MGILIGIVSFIVAILIVIYIVKGSSKKKVFTIEEKWPFLSFEDGCLIHVKDGIISIGYRVKGIPIEKLNGSQLVNIHKKCKTAIDSLPEEGTITLYDIYHEREVEFKNNTGSVFEQKMIDTGEKKKIEHKSYMFITIIPEKHSSIMPTSTLLNSGNKSAFKEKDYLNIEVKKEYAKKVANDFINLIQVEGLQFSLMSKSEVSKEITEYLNMEFTSEKELGKNDFLCNEFEKNLNYYAVGGKIVNVVSLAGQGEYAQVFKKNLYVESGEGVNRNFASSIHLDLQIPHVVVTRLRKKLKEKALKSAKKEVHLVNVMPDGMPSFKDAKDRVAVLSRVLEEINAKEDGMVLGSVQVISFARSHEEQQYNLDQIKNAIGKMENAKAAIETFDNQPLFWACLPGNASENYKDLVMTTEVGACYLNFNENYESEEKGEIFRDRFNNLIRRDLTNRKMPAKNFFIAGSTGTGKSFLANGTVLNSYLRGEIQVIVDKGGSYKNIITQLEGKYLEHTEESPLRINPFMTAKEDGKYILDDDKRILLRTLMEVILKEKKTGEAFVKAEKSFIVELFPEYYDDVNKRISEGINAIPKLEDFVRWVERENKERVKNGDERWIRGVKKFDIDNFLTVMETYIGDGMYAKIINPDEEEELGKFQLIGFDLENIQVDDTLYPIMAMLIVDLVTRHVGNEKIRDKIKRVMFDEAWSMFTGEMSDLIVNMYRTIRKKNGGVGVITQSVQDIMDSALSQVLINNSNVKILMNHSNVNTDVVQKALNYNDHQMDLLKSLRFESKRNAREFLLDRMAIGTEVLGFNVADEIYPLFTTEANEVAHFNRLKKQHSFERAIVEFVKDKKAGAIKYK